MPEGPEVETIRRGLAAALPGRRIDGVEILFEGCFKEGRDRLEQVLADAEVAKVVRRGKVLVIELTSEWAFMVHLKMTGQLVLVLRDGDRLAGGHPTPSMGGALPDKSTRAVFRFAGGDRLFFNDQRKFGWIKLVRASDVDLDSLLSKLGPEVLSPAFDESYLAAALARHSRAPIKAVVLDQTIVAGVGNIYADEALHLARIHPARRAGLLRGEEILRLHQALRQIIESGIAHGGTSFSHYVDSLGGRGDYLNVARVFRRNGENCSECGSKIEKIRVAGRGTHVCPVCQPLETVS